MEVVGWLEMFVVGAMFGMDEGMVEGGRGEEREGKGDSAG